MSQQIPQAVKDWEEKYGEHGRTCPENCDRTCHAPSQLFLFVAHDQNKQALMLALNIGKE